MAQATGLNGEYDEIDKLISVSLHDKSTLFENADALKDKKVNALLEGKDPNHVKSEDYRNSLDKSYERQ